MTTWTKNSADALPISPPDEPAGYPPANWIYRVRGVLSFLLLSGFLATAGCAGLQAGQRPEPAGAGERPERHIEPKKNPARRKPRPDKLFRLPEEYGKKTCPPTNDVWQCVADGYYSIV